MNDFSLTLDGKEYRCTSTSGNSDGWDCNITVSHGEVRTTIHIPAKQKITRAKIILFIEAFHVAMHKAFEAQQLDQNYVWNQKHTMEI